MQRSLKFSKPVCGDFTLYEHVRDLLFKLYTRRICLTKVGLGLFKLSYPYGQLDLFADDKEERLMKAMDSIRGKFGVDAISYGFF